MVYSLPFTSTKLDIFFFREPGLKYLQSICWNLHAQCDAVGWRLWKWLGHEAHPTWINTLLEETSESLLPLGEFQHVRIQPGKARPWGWGSRHWGYKIWKPGRGFSPWLHQIMCIKMQHLNATWSSDLGAGTVLASAQVWTEHLCHVPVWVCAQAAPGTKYGRVP